MGALIPDSGVLHSFLERPFQTNLDPYDLQIRLGDFPMAPEIRFYLSLLLDFTRQLEAHLALAIIWSNEI